MPTGCLACFCQPPLLEWISEVEMKLPAHFFFLWIRLLSVEMHKINDLWKRSGFCSLYKTGTTGIGGKIVYEPLFSIPAFPFPFQWSFIFVIGTNIREGWGQLLLLLGEAVPCIFPPTVFCPVHLIQSWRPWQAWPFWHRLLPPTDFFAVQLSILGYC